MRCKHCKKECTYKKYNKNRMEKGKVQEFPQIHWCCNHPTEYQRIAGMEELLENIKSNPFGI